MGTAPVIAILLGSAAIATAIVLKPTSFDRCVALISADIEREAARTAVTLDPRDMESDAARICAGETQE